MTPFGEPPAIRRPAITRSARTTRPSFSAGAHELACRYIRCRFRPDREARASASANTEEGESMAERLVVAGAGMVPFMAAGSHASGMAERAIRNALDDAGVDVELIDQAVASHVHGDSSSGERALARAGLTGIAISNVSNGCASGSVALFHARQALLSGEAQCVLAVGFEETRESPHGRCAARAVLQRAPRLARASARESATRRSRALPSRLARTRRAIRMLSIASRCRSTTCWRRRFSLGRLRRSYVSDASCGAAAVVLCTPRFAALHGLRDDVLLVAHALESDDPANADSRDVVDALAMQHDTSRGGTSVRERRRRSRRHRRCRSPRLLRRRRTDFLRGARPLRAGRHRAVRALRCEHLRRLGRRLAVRRDAFDGRCAGRDGHRANLRACLAASWRSGRAPGRRRTHRLAAQRRTGRRGGSRHPETQGLGETPPL